MRNSWSHLEPRRLHAQALVEPVDVATSRTHRHTQQLAHGHARDRDRVLHREEQAPRGSLPRGEPEELVAVDRDGPARDLVVAAAHEHVRQRRLPGAVRPHQHVHLPRGHLEVDAAQDLEPLDRRVQVTDSEHAHGSVTTTSSPSTRTP